MTNKSFYINCPECDGSGKGFTEIISHGLVDYESSWPCHRCEGNGTVKVMEINNREEKR